MYLPHCQNLCKTWPGIYGPARYATSCRHCLKRVPYSLVSEVKRFPSCPCCGGRVVFAGRQGHSGRRTFRDVCDDYGLPHVGKIDLKILRESEAKMSH